MAEPGRRVSPKTVTGNGQLRSVLDQPRLRVLDALNAPQSTGLANRLGDAPGTHALIAVVVAEVVEAHTKH